MAVYFIRPIGMRGPVKIGCAAFPLHRLDTLMAWSPFPLEIAGTVEGDMDLERRLHGLFAASHTHKEWFTESDELSSLIGELAKGTPIGDCIDLNAPLSLFRSPKRRSDESRRRMSYSGRLRWAFDRLRGTDRWCKPNDVSDIMFRWSGWGGNVPVPPSPEEIARLEEVIASPAAHAVLPSWEREEEAA